jgi:hypothetical protein
MLSSRPLRVIVAFDAGAETAQRANLVFRDLRRDERIDCRSPLAGQVGERLAEVAAGRADPRSRGIEVADQHGRAAHLEAPDRVQGLDLDDDLASEGASKAWVDELRRPAEDRVDEVDGRLDGLWAQVDHCFWDQSHRLGRVRGSPKWPKTPVSKNQVIAATASPSSMSTNRL